MRRKVVKQGPSTLMISLPSAWVKTYEITKGSDLEVEEQEKRLLISTERSVQKEQLEVDIAELYPMNMATVKALYKAGYDNLKITFSDSKKILDIQNAPREEITGFEITEQGSNYCIVHKIEEGVMEGFEPILRRTFLLLLTMAEKSIISVKEKDLDELKQLAMLETSNNRFTTYCLRQLSKTGYKKPNKLQFIYMVVDKLEKIANEYKLLLEYLADNQKKDLSEETYEYYEKVSQMMRTVYNIFYDYDKKHLVKLGKLKEELNENANKRLENTGDVISMHHLMTLGGQIFELAEPCICIHF